MYTGKKYPLWMTVMWTRDALAFGLSYSFFIAIVGHTFGFEVAIPWQPIGALGIAVSFYLGFKSNKTYSRAWDARKAFGGLVDDSRSFAIGIASFVQGPSRKDIRKNMIHRQIAWLKILGLQLRLKEPWENASEEPDGEFLKAKNRDFLYYGTVSEGYKNQLNRELKSLVSEEEVKRYEGKSNVAVQILHEQAKMLQELRDKEYISEHKHMELYKIIVSMLSNQGQVEDVKGYPLPRQYASTAFYLVWAFILVLPLGLYHAFDNPDTTIIFWGFPIVSGVIIWIFLFMEKICTYTENPFEGNYNDVPVTTLSRSVEIDLREMLNEENIPNPMKTSNGFLL